MTENDTSILIDFKKQFISFLDEIWEMWYFIIHNTNKISGSAKQAEKTATNKAIVKELSASISEQVLRFVSLS
jgi:hypothetical protein